MFRVLLCNKNKLKIPKPSNLTLNCCNFQYQLKIKNRRSEGIFSASDASLFQVIAFVILFKIVKEDVPKYMTL